MNAQFVNYEDIHGYHGINKPLSNFGIIFIFSFLASIFVIGYYNSLKKKSIEEKNNANPKDQLISKKNTFSGKSTENMQINRSYRTTSIQESQIALSQRIRNSILLSINETNYKKTKEKFYDALLRAYLHEKMTISGIKKTNKESFSNIELKKTDTFTLQKELKLNSPKFHQYIDSLISSIDNTQTHNINFDLKPLTKDDSSVIDIHLTDSKRPKEYIEESKEVLLKSFYVNKVYPKSGVIVKKTGEKTFLELIKEVPDKTIWASGFAKSVMYSELFKIYKAEKTKKLNSNVFKNITIDRNNMVEFKSEKLLEEKIQMYNPKLHTLIERKIREIILKGSEMNQIKT